MPFFHSNQMVVARRVIDSMTGDNATMSLVQPFGAQEIINDGGTWKKKNQDVVGDQWIELSDQSYFIPDFRVVAVSVGLLSPVGSPAAYYHLNFDLPFPRPVLYRPDDATTHPAENGCGDWFRTGDKAPCWITRLRLNADTTATKITLWR